MGNSAAIIDRLKCIIQEDSALEECSMGEVVRYAVVPCMVNDEKRGYPSMMMTMIGDTKT